MEGSTLPRQLGIPSSFTPPIPAKSSARCVDTAAKWAESLWIEVKSCDQVSSLFWSEDDAKLLSAGLDGAVYQWNVAAQKRERENVLKGCNYACVIATDDLENVLVVGSDLKLKELEDIQGSMQITKDVSTDVRLTQLAMAHGKLTS